MFSLENRIALVTGATGEIGMAIVRAFHKCGVTVAISGRRENELKKLQDELQDRVHPFVCDLTDRDAVQGLVTSVEKDLGAIHIVVNNAGLTKDKLLIQLKDNDIADVLDVNLKAPLYIMRAAAKIMMRARYGRIINISSIVGITGNPGQVNYCASKAGLIGATKALAHEVATRGVTVNAIAPGFIASAMTAGLPEVHAAKLTQSIPCGKMGSGHDIAAASVFLASDEASYITGQTIHVNGGMVMV